MKSGGLFVLLVTFFLTGSSSAATGIVIEPVPREAIEPALPSGPLILPLEVNMDAARAFIRIGYGLDDSINFQSTEMLTPVMRTVQAQQLIRMVESYNNFEGVKVANSLTEFRGAVSGVQFGREGSPVIYIDLPYWTHQREETPSRGMGVRIPRAETEKLVARLRTVFVDTLKADEFSVDGNRVRAWWD